MAMVDPSVAFAASGGPGASSRVRALVVDDEPALVRVVAAYLDREGFDVTTAADGRFASVTSRPSGKNNNKHKGWKNDKAAFDRSNRRSRSCAWRGQCTCGHA